MASKKAGRAAGLAALAGLAYMATRDKGGKEAPSDSSYDTLESKRMPAKAEDATESGDFLSRRLNRIDTDDGKAYSTNNLSPMSSGKSASGSRAATVKAPSASESPQSSRFAPSGSPVGKGAAGIGNAKPVVADGGNRSTRLDLSGSSGGSKMGNAKPVVADGGSRSTRSDMQNVGSGIPGANRSIRSDASSSSSGEDGGNRSVRSDMPRSGLGDVRRPGTNVNYENEETSDMGMKRGGKVKKMASGGMTSSASSRGDGIASKGKTRCKMY